MPAPLRVFHFITTLDRGGAEKALLHLCAALAKSGRWEPRVAWLKGRGELAREFAAAGVVARKFSRREYGKFDADVVHTHLFKADLAGAALVGRKRRGRRVLVSTKHNEDRYLVGDTLRAKAWRALGRRAAQRADAVVGISNAVAAFFCQTLGEAAADMPVIPYGLPTPRTVAPEEAAAFRARLGVPTKAGLVLCVGRLDVQKDPRTAIRAMTRVSGDARLVLLGRGPLEQELRALGDPRVVFAGFLDDPAPAYAAADVVVLSSKWEGLGLALVEAAQYGKPVVATRVGGIREVVVEGETGLLVPEGDAESMGDGVAWLLADPELRARIGEAGRKHASSRFSVRRYADEIDALYTRLLEAPR